MDFAYKDLTDSSNYYLRDELSAGVIIFNVSSEEFEGTVDNPTDWYAEGK